MVKKAKADIEFRDNPLAPSIFSTAVSGFFLSNGVLTMTFEAAQVDHVTSPGPVSRVVVMRLTLPVQGAQALSLSLYDFLKNQGLDPIAGSEGASFQ